MNHARLLTAAAVILLTTALSHAAKPIILVIDPGHGGKTSSGSDLRRTLSSPNNATTPGGTKEKDLTLELSLAIRDAIKKEADKRKLTCQVVLTREDDSNPDFAERAKRTLSKGVPDSITSIHFNASTNHNALGTLAMISRKSGNPNYETDHTFAAQLTAACSAAIQKYLPSSKPKSPITDGHLHNGKGSNFFHQMAQYPELQTVPKCFLEVEFMDRQDVEANLLQQRQKAFPEIATAIATSLIDQATRN